MACSIAARRLRPWGAGRGGGPVCSGAAVFFDGEAHGPAPGWPPNSSRRRPAPPPLARWPAPPGPGRPPGPEQGHVVGVAGHVGGQDDADVVDHGLGVVGLAAARDGRPRAPRPAPAARGAPPPGATCWGHWWLVGRPRRPAAGRAARSARPGADLGLPGRWRARLGQAARACPGPLGGGAPARPAGSCHPAAKRSSSSCRPLGWANISCTCL